MNQKQIIDIIDKREVEFRAWQKDMHMIVYPKPHYVERHDVASRKKKEQCWEDYIIGEVYNPEENEYHTVLRGDDNFILMQYTGFKDRNGVKVFEGDIVEMEKCVGVIVQMGSCWALQYEHNVDKGIDSYKGIDAVRGFCNSMVKLGNIFENPELFKNEE